MSNKTFTLAESLYDYMLSVSLREPDILCRLREETARDPMAIMQIAPEQGQFMALLVQLVNARNLLEIGVFTGYSTLWMAMALPEDARLVACDISKEWTSAARRYWAEAGKDQLIDLRIAPALETMDSLLADGQAEGFDFIFIDADKENYDGYYERALRLVRKGGLILIDNTLWSGAVADPAIQDRDTRAIRALNQRLHTDKRVLLSLLPVADGLTLLMKK